MFKKISKKKIASISSLILSIIIVIISSVIFWFTPVNKKITTSTDITNNSSYIIFNPGVLQAVSSNSLINITTNSSDTLQIAYGNYKDANGFLADDTNYTTITGFSSINSWQTQNILPTKTVLSDNLDISQSDMFDLIATSNGQISFDLNSLGSFNNDSTLIITRKGSLTPIQLAIDWTNNSTDTISHFGFILGLILLLGSVIGFVISPNKSKHTKSIEKKPLVHHISHKVKKLNQTGIVEYDISKINQIDNKNIKTKTRFNVNKDIKRVKEKTNEQSVKQTKLQSNKKFKLGLFNRNHKTIKGKHSSKSGYTHMKSVLFAITISLSLFLTSSCAGQTPTLEQNTANLSPNLTIEQQQKVFSNILNTLEYADEHNDSQYLKNRLYGPELKIRTAQLTEKRYTNKMPNTAVIPQMTDQLIISNNSGWPRINAIITKPTSDMQSQRLLFITQNNARNNYKLWGLVRIFPNTTLPKFNSALNGSQSLLSDDSTLLKSPSQVLNDYADFLQNANKSNTNSQFNTDPFMEQLNSITNTVQQGVNQNLGSQSQNYKADINNLQAVRTADGGALIMGQIDSYWKRTAGGGRLSKPASTEEEAIFGNTPARQTILVHYINVVAIYIPVKNNPSQSIQVIGAERMPVDAKAE